RRGALPHPLHCAAVISPRRLMNRATPALAAGLLAAGLAACGDDAKSDTLTKAQVISRGTVICKAAEKKVATLPELQVEHPFAKGTTAAMHRQARAFLTGYASLLDSSRRGLRALKAPEQSRDLLDGYLRDTGLVVAELRAAARAPGAQVEAKANAAFTRFAKASEQTRKY